MPKWLKGCLIALLLLVCVGYYLYVSALQYATTAAADGIEFVVEEMCKQTEFPAEETIRIMHSLKKFTKKIRIGEIGVFDVMNVGKSLGTGYIPFLFMMKTFERKYLAPFDMDEKDRKAAERTVSRFQQGIVEKKIGIKKMEQLHSIFTELDIKTFSGKKIKKTRLKDKLIKKELMECLKFMKTETDNIKIPDKDFKIDLQVEIGKAIKRGLPQKLR